LLYTSSPRVYVIPQAYYEEVGAEGFAQHPISAGPYMFVSWQPDNVLIMQAYEDYFLGSPAIKEIQCRVLPDDAGRVAALRAGEIDIAAPLAIEQIPEVEGDANLMVVIKESLNRMYLTIDNTVAPFDQLEVRLAINHAIDRQLIIDQLLEGLAEIIPGGLVPGLEPGANTDLVPYTYDPELAIQLLADAGYPNGLEEEFGVQDLICRDGYGPKTEEVCTVMAEMLAAVGIPVQISIMENTAFETASAEKTIGPLMYSGHSGGGNFHGQHHLRSTKVCTERAGEVTTPLEPSAEWGGWYCNPAVDALVWEATQLWGSNYEQALADISAAEAIVYEDAAAGFLWAQSTAYGIRQGLNWQPPARPDYNFFGAFWEDGASG
jgi:ABC-type transport system substrate-binding protein